MTDEMPFPPWDELAEQALLGAVMSSERGAVEAVELLTSDEFYKPAHGTVFAAAAALLDAGKPVDPVTVLAELERTGNDVRVGGAPYLHTLYALAPAAGSVPWYAERIADKATRRRLLEAGQRVIQLAGLGDTAVEAAEAARQVLDTAAQGTRTNGELNPVRGLVDEALSRYENPVPPGVPTGLPDLDDVLGGGLRPGGLYIIGARPGGGKSVLGCNIAASAAQSGLGVLLASLEMPKEEVVDRLIANEASVELSNIVAHQLSSFDWPRVKAAGERIRSWSLMVWDETNVGVGAVRARARDLTRTTRGLGLVVVDYLQLLKPVDARAIREQQVASFSRGLKLLAKELRVPVVALSQVGRGAADKKPAVSDLRESGAIEADADAVFLLYEDTDKPGELQVSIAKNRHGRKGAVSLAWSPHYGRVRPLARHLEAV